MSGKMNPSWNVDAAKAALILLRPNKRMEVESHFSEVIAEIRDALQRKVPRKAIRLALRDAGLRLAPAKLNELIERSTGREQVTTGLPRRVKKVPFRHLPEAISDASSNQVADARVSD